MLLLSPTTYRAAPFMEAAARLGLEVLQAVDLPPALAEVWQVPLGVDFREPEAAAEQLIAYARENPIGAIISVDDSASFIAALVAGALGLPHNSPDAALAARDKYLMRQRFAAAGVPSPRFKQFELDAEPAVAATQVRYPCVVKPRILSGSRGVIRADDPRELIAAFARTAALLRSLGFRAGSTGILVEDYIPGVEVALEGLLTERGLNVLALFDTPDPLEGPFFEETIYVTPSRWPAATQAAIAACTEAAASALGLRVGPVHAELRVNEQGPWMVEMAGRSIGGLCSQTLQFGTDLSLEELILRQAFGYEVEALDRTGAAGGVNMIPIPSAGILRCVDGIAEAQAVPGVDEVQITAKLHDRLVPLPEGASYLGFIFAHGETAEQVETALREAHSYLRFEIDAELPILNPFIGVG
ncbi:MAG TPA: ATP-grasp domain-containing protein [Ardenticatenaceae bacterium]|nr:ATP-grasp domain-containing protein [Ardenticatenaceae bacterium]